MGSPHRRRLPRRRAFPPAGIPPRPRGATDRLLLHLLGVARDAPLASGAPSPPPPSERENLAAFSQAGGVTRCALQAGALYESTSITYTPECLDRLRKAFPGDFDDVDEAMRSFDPASAPAEMLSVLRSFTPARAALPGAAAYFHAKALEAIAALSMRPGPAAPKARREDRELVEQAEAVMSARLVAAHRGVHRGRAVREPLAALRGVQARARVGRRGNPQEGAHGRRLPAPLRRGRAYRRRGARGGVCAIVLVRRGVPSRVRMFPRTVAARRHVGAHCPPRGRDRPKEARLFGACPAARSCAPSWFRHNGA